MSSTWADAGENGLANLRVLGITRSSSRLGRQKKLVGQA
jgi:hypothetical protein